MNNLEFHKPVLINEILQALKPKDNEVFLDTTFGVRKTKNFFFFKNVVYSHWLCNFCLLFHGFMIGAFFQGSNVTMESKTK